MADVSGAVDLLGTRKIAMVASNPATSPTTGWPVGFWWAELTHPYWEFVERGFEVGVYSPDGGRLEADKWSDPRDDSGYSADDLISLGFINSPDHLRLVEESRPIAELGVDDSDAVLFIGGQGPMVTFYEDERVHGLAAAFYDAGKVTCVICHATALLLKARRADGSLIVDGRTWTGFANSEEDYVDEWVGRRIQPFRIEDEAKRIPDTNFIVAGRFKAHAVRDGNLITGQQQYSGTAAARLVVEALGV
jgi:putative intracellular protease/amidase